MKITRVNATLFQHASPRGVQSGDGSSSGATDQRCLVELFADNGLSGIAIANSWARHSVLALAQGVLIGQDPRTASALWQHMGEHLSGGEFHHARAVLDLAVWDLKAKANDEPLWKTLGGARPRANAFAGRTARSSGDGLAEWFGRMSLNHGFRGGCVRVGTDLEADMKHLSQARDALLPATARPELMIDAGGRWWPKEAIRNIRKIESQYDLTFVRGATQSGDFLASKRVSDGIRAAVCVGGELTSGQAFLPYLHHHAANVIEINLDYFGVTGALQLADAAYGFELPVSLSATAGNLPVHLAAVMPNFMNMEVTEPEPDDGIIASDVTFADGWGIAGDAAGHGLSVHPELLARSTVETGVT